MGATNHDLHIDTFLTEFAINFTPRNFIAPEIFPQVNVSKQSNTYPIFSTADAYRIEDDTRAPGNEANRFETGVSSDTYFARNRALKRSITIEDLSNMDDVFKRNLREGRAASILNKLNLAWERRISSQITSANNVGSSSTVTSAWTDSDAGDSDPILNVQTAMRNVQDATGEMPNRIVMGDLAWRNFREHADVISRIFGTTGTGEPRLVSMIQAAGLFEVDKFMVGKAYSNTSEEGQDQTLSLLWSDQVIVYFAPDRPSIEEPSFGYSIRWQQPGLPNMIAEVHPFDARRKSEEVEVGYYQDEKITAKELSFLIRNVTSAQ